MTRDQIVPHKVAWDDEAPDDGFEILGGQEAQFGKHRYVAGLKRSPIHKSYCGGSLIAPNVILTAEHCLGNATSVVVGTHYIAGFADGELATVTQKIKHSNGSDVGIIILDRNLTAIKPVGVSFEFAHLVLKEVSITTWDNTRTWIAHFRPLPDSVLGAGGKKGEDSWAATQGGR
ncbi:hypothetical protein H257_17714 [Aphanomyces astaci]|uniref:Peptidase S1 domain-containing protein n=1 Tax=Aphanomyces astaci TaxID=112090 RepID=W4FDS1_APHAT|nr:hypothetical protein H257_17714 [Aphanomyces astaci]ETV65605.1 hypothetical protein H257_17714 [Aphanomyces astaci]|eukprot:XP_009844902.1 hypothetical protein H257_17714 [Aphanomyces astaci]